MDTTYQTSVLLVDVEVTPTQVGQLVVHLRTHVVEVLKQTEETSELETTVELGLLPDMIHTEDGVIVTNMLILQRLHL